MAIPNSPEWSSLTDIKAYPIPVFEKPDLDSLVTSVSLGPITLNNSQGVLNSRYWKVSQDSLTGVVHIAGAVGSEWGASIDLFLEESPIGQISLSFDQLGRPLVFYRVGTSTLKLYWYDPLLQESVNVVFAEGIDPLAGFDFPQDTGQPFTDALLFYVRDNSVYMRVQRDRFNVEYLCPVTDKTGVKLNSTGLRVDNRYQVEYQYNDTDYVAPPKPEPVIPDLDAYYKHDGTSCLISNKFIDVVQDVFKLGFTLTNVYFPNYTENVSSKRAYKEGQVLFGSNSRKGFYCYIERDTRTNLAIINLWRGFDEHNGIFELNDFNGEWVFEFNGLNPQVKIIKDGVTLFDGLLARPSALSSLVNVAFAGAPYENSTTAVYPFYGVQHSCWIEQESSTVLWPVQTNRSAVQNPTTEDVVMTIQNHKLQNWTLN